MAALLFAGLRTTNAADHGGDTDGNFANPGTDFGDFYAWMDADGENLNLIATLTDVEVSNATQYAFHVHSGSAYLMTDNTPTDIICQFAAADDVECWVGDPERGGVYVTGDPSDPAAPLTDANGSVKVFAGVRNDPFFFNAGGFLAVAGQVEAAAQGGLGLDATGCPILPAATAAVLRDLLVSDGAGGAGQDDFAGRNVFAIVVQVSKTLVTGNGTMLSAWVSSHTR